MTSTESFKDEVALRQRGEQSEFLTWWKLNEKRFPTHQFARAEFDRLQREAATEPKLGWLVGDRLFSSRVEADRAYRADPSAPVTAILWKPALTDA